MNALAPERVVIISDFSRVRGGASKLALLQAELLSAKGIPVTYFAGDTAEIAPKGYELIALGGQKLLEQDRITAALGGLWNLQALRRLKAWIAGNDTASTVYHLHGYHQTLSPSVLAALKPVASRVVMHAHDYFLACPNGAFFDFREGSACPRRAMSVSCLAHNCDKRSYGQKVWRMTRQTLQNRARAQLLPGVTTILLHDGMAGRLFPDGLSGRTLTIANPAAPLRAPVEAARNQDFLYVGDIHAYKGVFLLADAGRKARLSIRFIGEGQDLARLAEAFPEHRYEGWQDRNGLAAAMARARMLVAPTLGPEPYGLAPVEAILSGVPALISDSMLLSSDVLLRRIGETFVAGDVEDLSVKLAILSKDDARVAQMSRNAQGSGHEISSKPLEWRDRLLELYHELLKAERAS